MHPLDRTAWFQGRDAACAAQPETRLHPWRLVLLGAPGVGKGTQAELLGTQLGACHLSTGDIFRAARKMLTNCTCSPAMLQAIGHMDAGELVPDETVLSLISERSKCFRCGGGFLLDGFPRTVAQAEALEKLLKTQQVKLDAVLSYELSFEKLIARLSGRRLCPKCKAVFHVESRPPRTNGCCDHCGASLYQRDDDRPEAIRVRLAVYEKSTVPLVDFFRQRGLLLSIPAEGTPDEILHRALTALDRKPRCEKADVH